jgi:hypothetical protein
MARLTSSPIQGAPRNDGACGRPSSHFYANPGRQIELLVFIAQLDFRYDKTEVLAREHIDFIYRLFSTMYRSG